jgi:Holliday junction resolvase RusA-like endonuclease
MRTKTYIINKPPVPWARPGLSGKRFFDTQTQDKLIYGIYLQQQHGADALFYHPSTLDICFFMPCSVKVSTSIKEENTEIVHCVRPDIDNLVKFALDAMRNIIIIDDKIIYSINAKKIYDSKPRTEFTIKEL